MTLVPAVKTKPKALLLILEVQLFEVLWGKFSQCLTQFISNMEKFSSVTILLELLLHHLTLIAKHYMNTRKYKEARPNYNYNYKKTSSKFIYEIENQIAKVKNLMGAVKNVRHQGHH